MTSANPYRLTADDSRSLTGAGNRATNVFRVLLWLVLVVSAVGNTIASFAGAGIGIHLACGGVTALCIAVLVVQRLRNPR